ncbi:MAG: fibronectin type III domain-containing protein, partial [Elusimicrobiota bacterium]|nr:fibronectin type III domain-containing protein [Elusimicrobiota bacterium]
PIKDFEDIPAITPVTIAPSEARVDETIPVLKLSLTTYCDATLLSLIVAHNGTSSTDSVKQIKIYKDADNDGEFSSADTQYPPLGSGTFGNDTPPSPPAKSKILITPTTVYYDAPLTLFVVYELNSETTPDKTVGAIISYPEFEFNIPNKSPASGSFFSNLITLLDKRTPSIPSAIMKFDNPNPIKMPDTNRDRYFTNNRYGLEFSWQATVNEDLPEEPKINRIKYGIASSSGTGTSIPPADVTGWLVATSTDVSFTNLNLKHNTVYYLWITVYSKDKYDNEFSRTNFIEFKVDATPPLKLSPPTHSRVASASNNNLNEFKSNAIAQSSYWVMWSAATDEESGILAYELQERLDTSPLWITISSNIPATQTDYQITNREEKKFYYYRIRAKNYAGSW